MKLSTKGRYGVRAMFELALHYGEDEPVAIKVISENQDISESYLEQLFGPLRKAGLIISTRGAQGGYMLSRAPEKITVADMLNVLEGPIEVSECLLDDEAPCTKANYCATRVLWKKISDSINQVINSTTLQDMVNDYYQMNPGHRKERNDTIGE